MKMSDDTDKESCFLSYVARHRFNTPFPIHHPERVCVDPSEMSGFFGAVWKSLVAAAYPGSSFDAASVISREKFSLVCEYLATARIDSVRGRYLGSREFGAVAVPRQFAIPRCLADVLNGIGVVTVLGGAVVVLPRVAAAAAQHLLTEVRSEDLIRFRRLAQAAEERGFIRTAQLSDDAKGSAWWLLSARRAANRLAMADGDDAVQVLAGFKEWTPADAAMCALVQRRFHGFVPNLVHSMLWSCGSLENVALIREIFILKA